MRPKSTICQPKILSFTAVLVLLVSPQVFAQVLDEITVTSQKRAEPLSDVPISISAIDGGKIEDARLQRLEELSTYVPNFSVIHEPIGDKINIRGIQSGAQAGFEQSVAVFVDDLYQGRGITSRWSFLDVERVEVLRGPQPTLFGKNTVAGALNITTAGPTEEAEGEFSASFTPEFDATEIQGVVSGPLSESLRGRFMISSRDTSKGWVDNVSYNEDVPATEELFYRASLEWDAGDNTLVSFKHESGDIDMNGQPWVLIEHGPLSGVLAAVGIPEGIGYQSAIGNNGFAPFGLPADPVLDLGSNSQFDADTRTSMLRIDHTLGSGLLITGIAGISAYDYERFGDVDMSPVPLVRFDDTEDFEQTSLELRLTSDTGGRFEYIGGLYYQDSDLYADALAQFSLGTADLLLGGACASVPGGPVAVVSGDPVASAIAVAGLTGATASATNACAQTALTQSLLPAGVNGASRYAFLDQNSESIAVFAQGTWKVSDVFRVTGGLRYTGEDKKASQGAYAAQYAARDTAPLADQSPANPQALAAFLIGEFTTHSFAPSDPGMTRNEDSVTWSLNAQWDAGDETMLYASASTGFKAGGFNSFYLGLPQAAGADSMDVAFEEEEVLSFEFGAKMTLLDGSADLNIAAFHTSYDDLQVSLFSGNTTFVVQNAAMATSMGIEMDGRWHATENLTFQASLGWLNFEYDSFMNQGCVAEQFLDFREGAFQAALAAGDQVGAGIASLAVNNQSCANAGVNDLKGRPSAHSPEWTAALIANHHLAIGDYELATVVDLIWSDDVYRQDDLDPLSMQPAFAKLNLTLSFGPQDGIWDVAVIAKNVTDETTISYVNDTPLANGARQARVDQPFNVSLRGRVRF